MGEVILAGQDLATLDPYEFAEEPHRLLALLEVAGGWYSFGKTAQADAVLKASYGLKPSKRSKIKGGGFRKAEPQRKASTPVEKWKGY